MKTFKLTLKGVQSLIKHMQYSIDFGICSITTEDEATLHQAKAWVASVEQQWNERADYLEWLYLNR